jgi:DNA modification methylase
MKKWKDEGVKVQTCVTSPPYYGLRDYGHDGQIGLEETPQDYINAMVKVFRCVKDILADDGTLWVNIGDSYSSHKDCKSTPQSFAKGTPKEEAHVMELGKSRVRDSKMLKSQGLKNKDLIGIPWMLAFALRADGWYLRQDIIWHKPNPMPESVADRCTKAHEYIFLLSKSDKYFFDNESIKEPSVTNWEINQKTRIQRKEATGGAISGGTGEKISSGNTRNKRSVWTVNTKSYKGAHFATFPTELIEPCIKAGAPEKICIECATPYKREKIVEKNLTLEEVNEIRKNIMDTNKERKPYAILDKEFRNQVVEYRNLPNHNELRDYLQFNRHLQELTIDEIENYFGTQAPHHWFEKNGSYPSKDDWVKLKKLLVLDNKYDQPMTEIFYKSGLKCANNYLDQGLIKQCKCETNETKTGIVLDPFMGSGTTAQVALNNGKQYLGCELNPEYKKLQDERLNRLI